LEKVEVKEEISADDVPDITYESAWNELEKAVRALGENIPPLMRQYAKLSRTMKTF
jgi:hypothetical protein